MTRKKPTKRPTRFPRVDTYSLSPEEIAKVERAARLKRLSRSKYVGDAALDAAERDLEAK